MQKVPPSPGTSAISTGHAGGGGGGGGGGSGGGGAGEAHIVHSTMTTVPSTASDQNRRRAALMEQTCAGRGRFRFASGGAPCTARAAKPSLQCLPTRTEPTRHGSVPRRAALVRFL